MQPRSTGFDYSPELMSRLAREGKTVFLDFTAKWCINCQVNERVALSNREVADKFRKLGVVAVKADWTRFDARITRALAGLGKNSIPVYVLYSRRESPGHESLAGNYYAGDCFRSVGVYNKPFRRLNLCAQIRHRCQHHFCRRPARPWGWEKLSHVPRQTIDQCPFLREKFDSL